MMYSNNNNNNFAFVCGVNTTNVSTLAGTTLEVADLANGDVCLVNSENEVLADTDRLSGGEDFKVATRLLDEAGVARLYYSPLFNMTNTTVTYGKSTAAAQQVTHIGSNGTTTVQLIPDSTSDANAQAEVGNSFYVLIEKQDNDEANRSGYHPAITAQVKLSNPDGFTDGQLIQARLGRQIREAIRVNDQLEASNPSVAGPKYIRCETEDVGVTHVDPAGSGADFNAITVFGSTTVTLSADTSNEVAAGDYVCFGLNSDMYRVDAVDTTGNGTYTLDFPYAGPSATFGGAATPGAATFSRVTAAELDDATGLGLRITGQAQHGFGVARDRIHSESRFNVRFAKDGENVGAAITRTTAATEGLGSYEQVATEEYHSMGQLGLRWVSDIPGQVRPGNAVVDTNYGCIRLSEVTTLNRGLVSGFTGRKQCNIWIQLEADGTTEATGNSPQDVLMVQIVANTPGNVDRS